MIAREKTLLLELKQLKINLFVPPTVSEHHQKTFLTKFFTTITKIFNAPGLFLFLEKVIAKTMQIAYEYANKIGGEYAKTFEEIRDKFVEKNSSYLSGTILYKSIKKMNRHYEKLDKKQKEEEYTMEILENILKDKQKLLKHYYQQSSEYKKLTSEHFKAKRIYYNDDKLENFEEMIAVIDMRKDDKAIEDQLKRKMVAVLNEGGGYIFLGKLFVDILQGTTSERLYQYREKIIKIKEEELIYPKKFYLEFEIVDLKEKNGKKIINEKILKITLFPQDYLLYFVSQPKKFDSKPLPENFTAKFLKYQDYCIERTFVLGKNEENCELMVKFYDAYYHLKRKKNRMIEETKSISQKIIENNKFRKEIIYKAVKKDKFLMKNDSHEPLKLIFRHQSIFMIKEQDKKLYANFTKNLDERKILYAASRPFEEYRSLSNKLIAVIDHDDKFETVYEIAKDTAGKKLNAFITVYPFVVIKEAPLSDFNDYEKVFKEKYGVSLKPYMFDEGNNTYNVYLKLKGEEESIFTFIFMEGKRVRTEFLKKAKYEEIIKN